MGKMKKTNKDRTYHKGFTLVELLVVVGIMALFSLTLVSVFLATIRGGNKSQLLQSLHQEGDYALKTMSRMIRGAEVVDCSADFTITNDDGGTTVFSQVTDDDTEKIASNSSKFLTGTVSNVSDLSFTCYESFLGNQVVTIGFTLTAGGAASQVQEKFTQDFSTSVATRNY